jgi:hypothetical protein
MQTTTSMHNLASEIGYASINKHDKTSILHNIVNMDHSE